jgi:hypothetical protein
MKKILIVLVVLALIGTAAWGQEEKQPTASVSFLLGGSFVAPIGVGAEFFLGNFGIGAELRFLFIAYQGEAMGTVEPGAYGRFYFTGLESSLFLFGGASYLTAWSTQSGTVEAGILKPKAGAGYAAMFGPDNRTRFTIELGAVGFYAVVGGEIADAVVFPFLPHFLLSFGRAF